MCLDKKMSLWVKGPHLVLSRLLVAAGPFVFPFYLLCFHLFWIQMAKYL